MGRKSGPSTKDPIPVEATRHRDKRKNIPTEDLRDFVRDEEARPNGLNGLRVRCLPPLSHGWL